MGVTDASLVAAAGDELTLIGMSEESYIAHLRDPLAYYRECRADTADGVVYGQDTG